MTTQEKNNAIVAIVTDASKTQAEKDAAIASLSAVPVTDAAAGLTAPAPAKSPREIYQDSVAAAVKGNEDIIASASAYGVGNPEYLGKLVLFVKSIK